MHTTIPARPGEDRRDAAPERGTISVWVRCDPHTYGHPVYTGAMRVRTPHHTWTESTRTRSLTRADARHEAINWRNQFLATQGLAAVATARPVHVVTCACGALAYATPCAACANRQESRPLARTLIVANGSKWAGEAMGSVEDLLRLLATEPLDHTFEHYGNFIMPLTRHPDLIGLTEFWGNFARVSHVFCVRTDDPELIGRLTAAIRANQARDDYGQGGTGREAPRRERRARDSDRV